MKKLVMTLLLTAGLVGSVMADECAVMIEGDDALKFSTKELAVPATCSEVTLTLKHIGKLPKAQMGHNVVITETPNFQTVAQASMGAGLENNYVVPGDERVLAATEVIGGGEETTLTFDVSGWDKSGDYTFFCSFPGHFAVMNGIFKFIQ